MWLVVRVRETAPETFGGLDSSVCWAWEPGLTFVFGPFVVVVGMTRCFGGIPYFQDY
jgi:hypothetical protein